MNDNITITLPVKGFVLLKDTLSFSGEKENSPKGEINSLRRLNGIDSSQRRHYMKAIESIVNKAEESREEKVNEAVDKWKEKNAKKKDEPDKLYDNRAMSGLNDDKDLVNAVMDIFNEENSIEVTDKTLEVVKRCFIDFGEKSGWEPAQDEIIETINSALQIKGEKES